MPGGRHGRGMRGRMMDPLMDPRSRFFMALSSDQRLTILETLKEGEKSLSEIAGGLAIDPSVVSRHLMMLRSLGMVSARREGLYVHFSIADRRIFNILALANQVISDWLKHNQQMFE